MATSHCHSQVDIHSHLVHCKSEPVYNGNKIMRLIVTNYEPETWGYSYPLAIYPVAAGQQRELEGSRAKYM